MAIVHVNIIDNDRVVLYRSHVHDEMRFLIVFNCILMDVIEPIYARSGQRRSCEDYDFMWARLSMGVPIFPFYIYNLAAVLRIDIYILNNQGIHHQLGKLLYQL